MGAASARPAWAKAARRDRTGVVHGGRQQRGLRRTRLGPHGPPDDPDQVEDRELEDEHQEDDLDHVAILGAAAPFLR
jgi:hypothetical protein